MRSGNTADRRMHPLDRRTGAGDEAQTVRAPVPGKVCSAQSALAAERSWSQRSSPSGPKTTFPSSISCAWGRDW